METVHKPAKSKRKRKATAVASVKLEPEQKKVKRSLSETDEQWQKYVKNKATTKAKKEIKAAAAATTTTPIVVAVKKEPKQKKKTKTNPLLKHREPCDLMRNEKRVEALASQVEVIEKISEENCEQKTLAVHLMPARARQTAATLALGHDNSNHIVYNDVDFCMEMKRLNYERTAASGEQTYPLQDLMGEQGFFSVNNEHVDQVVACIVKDIRTDIAYVKHSQAENGRGGAGGSMILGGAGGDTSNKKLNCIFGGEYYSMGYNRRKPELQYKKIKSKDVIDREERFEAFYRYDQLETETNFGEIPDNYKMFRELKRQNKEKYAQRNAVLCASAALTPKTDIEVVSREYIKRFREPPVDGEECCANRDQCVFNTFSSDRNVCYIGKVFYTEYERSRHNSLGDDSSSSSNTYRLCCDCLSAKWTIEWALNIQNGVAAERPINYFTVMCKPGQYGAHCMLSVIENDVPTGIVGHMTRFSHNNRRIVPNVRHIKKDGKYHQISVPVLEETGMDF